MNLGKILSNLPDNLAKSDTSNNAKLLGVQAARLDDNQSTIETMREWLDIDNSKGADLDRKGKNVGQPRNSMDDDTYRKWIKAKTIANLSHGEIETINKICTLLIGDRYGGLREGWTLPNDYPIEPKEATQLLKVISDGVNFGIPFDQVKLAKSGGVKVNWEWEASTAIQLATGFDKHQQHYPLCGTFEVGGVAF